MKEEFFREQAVAFQLGFVEACPAFSAYRVDTFLLVIIFGYANQRIYRFGRYAIGLPWK